MQGSRSSMVAFVFGFAAVSARALAAQQMRSHNWSVPKHARLRRQPSIAEHMAALEDFAKVAEFEAATQSRSEELGALTKARAAISWKTHNTKPFSFGLDQTFVSRSVLPSRGGLAKLALAKSEHSLELAQLASHVASSLMETILLPR